MRLQEQWLSSMCTCLKASGIQGFMLHHSASTELVSLTGAVSSPTAVLSGHTGGNVP